MPPGTDPDPGIPCSAAVALAQDTSYTYQPTQGAWDKEQRLWCIDATGAVVDTGQSGALRVYQYSQEKLAAATSCEGTTFASGGRTWRLVAGSAEAVAEAV